MIGARRVVTSFAFGAALAAACGFGDVGLEGKSCDESGRCSQGFACDKASNVCVRVTGGTATLPDGNVVPINPNGEIDPTAGDGGGASDGGIATGSDGNAGTDSTQSQVPPAFAVEDAGTTVSLNGVTVSSTGYAIAVGNGGTVLRRDQAGSWSPVTVNASEDLMGVASEGANVLAVGKGGRVLRSTNQGMSFASDQKGSDDLFGAAIVSGEGFAVGANTTYWKGPIDSPPTQVALSLQGGPWTWTSVWPENATTVHMVSLEGMSATWTGYGTSAMKTNASYSSVHGVPGTKPYATSHGDVFWFENGYVQTPVASADLHSIWIKSSSTAYVVGDVGNAWRKLGSAPWERLGTGTIADLRSVHGAGTLLLVVGADGTVLRAL